MVDFRRWITALAVLALFVGLASAQVAGPGTGNGPLACSATVAVPPALRAEGMTDLIGDIIITCTGGQSLTTGQVIPTANFTVSLGTNVTSRIIQSTGNISEAMLLIDEPGTFPALPAPGGAGTGPAATQLACLSTVGAGQGGPCVQYAQIATNGSGLPVASSSATSVTGAVNAFFGTVSGNQVTFNGIPVLPPVSSGITRVFRITNVRANISGLGGGGLPGTTQLIGSVSISGNTSIPVNNPTVIAGFVQAGLSTTLRNANNTGGLSGNGAGFNQCNNANTSGVAILSFSENFGTAFKTRVAPTATYNGQAGLSALSQHTPGTIYNSESGFIFGAPFATVAGNISFGAFYPGLADYGTRLKAVFNNVPAGVRLFVSVTNLAVNTSSATISPVPAGTAFTSFAQLVAGEAIQDGDQTVPLLNPTGGVNGTPAVTGIAEIPISGGSGTAVWEVINTNPSALETFLFGVWTTYSANPGNNSPPPGTATVNLSFAPTPPVPFSATAGAQAGILPLPRFADTSSAKNLLVINICQTLLLFPYVTNQAGFDTGIAIANTSTDPVGTGPQAGSCNLTFYDGTGKVPAVDTGSIATGTVYTNLASVVAAGFQGYMFAQCKFQYAHGFAFISDLGARNLAMGYLALVVNSSFRGPSAESLAH